MADNMKYWSNVFKRVLYVILAIIGIYLGYKFAIFYMPFLIAFIISLMIEPLIRKVMRFTNLTRKASAIITLIIVFSLIIGLLKGTIFFMVDLLKNIVIFLLTGYADKENAIRAINEVGLYRYIEKPWSNDDLIINKDIV